MSDLKLRLLDLNRRLEIARTPGGLLVLAKQRRQHSLSGLAADIYKAADIVGREAVGFIPSVRRT